MIRIVLRGVYPEQCRRTPENLYPWADAFEVIKVGEMNNPVTEIKGYYDR